MTATRLGHPRPEPSFTIMVNGRPVEAWPGESIAAVLLAAGRRVFRQTAGHAPRGFFCGMGICFDCLITLNGVPNVRSCVTPAAPDCVVEAPE